MAFCNSCGAALEAGAKFCAEVRRSRRLRTALRFLGPEFSGAPGSAVLLPVLRPLRRGSAPSKLF